MNRLLSAVVGVWYTMKHKGTHYHTRIAGPLVNKEIQQSMSLENARLVSAIPLQQKFLNPCMMMSGSLKTSQTMYCKR
jgi:hypothetical protein